MDLTRYLIGEVLQSHEARMASLRQYFPEAKTKDWTLAEAGQRVQIIKRMPKGRGKLEFGTELVAGSRLRFSGTLGASPGASGCCASHDRIAGALPWGALGRWLASTPKSLSTFLRRIL